MDCTERKATSTLSPEMPLEECLRHAEEYDPAVNYAVLLAALLMHLEARHAHQSAHVTKQTDSGSSP